jgi:hypothetical protein
MELDKALSECQDLNNVLINFKQTKDSTVYQGEGRDGRTYFIQVNKPVMCTVSIIKK